MIAVTSKPSVIIELDGEDLHTMRLIASCDQTIPNALEAAGFPPGRTAPVKSFLTRLHNELVK